MLSDEPSESSSNVIHKQSSKLNKIDAKSARDDAMGSRKEITKESDLKLDVCKSIERLDSKVSVTGDMEIEDLDDLYFERTVAIPQSTVHSVLLKNRSTSVRPITYKEAVELRYLLFGSQSVSFNTEWLNQGFCFNSTNSKLIYGLVQFKGGPCGVLAAIQAYIFRFLLFSTSFLDVKTKPRQYDKADVKKASINAIAHIVWKAGDNNKCLFVLPTEKSQFALGGKFKSDGVTETLQIYEFVQYEYLVQFIEANLSKIVNGCGVVLVLYSVIFSRTMCKIKADMDVSDSHLMGAHGYCTQEMVNLMLIGKACSNVFDGVIELDSGGESKSILKGILKRSEIGFLSLFEHYNSCEVGENMKSPLFPIWVVCSESHFTVLFSLNKSIVKNESIQQFDLYYYDGLAGQDDEIQLSIALNRKYQYDDLIPPLDHCIRTKWKGACIDWNGYEPML